jgi:hypothetical protein
LSLHTLQPPPLDLATVNKEDLKFKQSQIVKEDESQQNEPKLEGEKEQTQT